VQEVRLATTEFFMPILVGMELPDFESYVRFCLFENSHDLATSRLDPGRPEAAARPEDPGRHAEGERRNRLRPGVGGVRCLRHRRLRNMGVGEVTATLSIYTRRQKGRHIVF
jgi:hypothetical protein